MTIPALQAAANALKVGTPVTLLQRAELVTLASALEVEAIPPVVTLPPAPVVTATASNAVPGLPAATAINGNLKDWWSAKGSPLPQWLEVNLGAQRSVSRVTVYSVQDRYDAPSEPTDTMTFSLYGLQDFRIEANGVVLGVITGNDKIKRIIDFSPITTDRILIVVTKTPDGNARVGELAVA